MDHAALFNTQVNDLLDQLLKIFPNDDRINSAKLKLRLLTTLNKAKPLELFVMHSLGHKNEIVGRDEKYFMDRSEQIISKIDEAQEFDMNNIADIKDKWAIMTPEQKSVIWQYMGILVKIGEKYVAALIA